MRNARCKRRGVRRCDQHRLLSVARDVAIADDIAGHHWQSGGHCLNQHDAERLAAGGRRNEDIGRPVDLRQILVGDLTKHLDARANRARKFFDRVALRSVTDHQQTQVGISIGQQREGAQGERQSFAWVQAPHKKQVAADWEIRRARRPRKPFDIHPIRDDRHVALAQPTFDRAPSRLADGEPTRDEAIGRAQQGSGCGIQAPLQGLAGKVGVKRGDDRGRR